MREAKTRRGVRSCSVRTYFGIQDIPLWKVSMCGSSTATLATRVSFLNGSDRLWPVCCRGTSETPAGGTTAALGNGK
jgi:hypothetical protein